MNTDRQTEKADRAQIESFLKTYGYTRSAKSSKSHKLSHARQEIEDIMYKRELRDINDASPRTADS